MKATISLLLCCLFLDTLAQPGRDDIHLPPQIRAIVRPAAQTDQVYVTGSLPELGNWNPSKTPMESLNDSTWVYYLKDQDPGAFEFKLTLGSWDHEALDKEGKKFANFQWTEKTVMMWDTIFGWSDPSSTNALPSSVTGEVRFHEVPTFDGIQARKVVVWLPPDYGEQRKKRYPVLYMHDGQNLFDNATAGYGVEWQVDETMTRLIEEKKIPPMIVVGIYNSSERFKEYLSRDTSEIYRRLLIEKVKPMIDKEYRTSKKRKDTYTAGSSAGGGISFSLAWHHPEVFAGAICFSPAFTDPFSEKKRFDLIDTVRVTENAPDVRYYIYNGGVELEAQLQAGVDTMIDVLKSKGFKEGKQLSVAIDPEAEHNEAAWAKVFGEAVVWLVNGEWFGW